MPRSGRHAFVALVLSILTTACAGDTTAPDPGSFDVIPNNGGQVSVVAGASANLAVALERVGRFEGPIALSVEGAPAGVTATVTPATVAAGAVSATVSVSATGAVTPQNYTLTLRGTGADVPEVTTSIFLTVTPAPAFTFAVAPTSLTLAAGASGVLTVTISRSGGFTGAVNASVSGLPTGVTATSPVIAAGATSAQITLQAGAAMSGTTATLTARGTATGLTDRTATVGLTVTGAPLSWTQVDVGNDVSCGIATTGVTYCWGSNGSAGMLGIGSTAISAPNDGFYYPNATAGGIAFAAVSVGNTHACGITADGTAYCWGFNAYGQLGTGDATVRTSPTQIGGALRFQSISAGRNYTCAVTTGDAAYCWGQSSFALGLGSLPSSDVRVPTAVAGGVSFESIAAADQHTCALTAAGLAYCWGSNSYGMVGTGVWGTSESGSYSTPQATFGGVAFTSIGVGFLHSCGTTSTGLTYCWGATSTGQLGNGQVSNSVVADRPTLVNTDLRFRQTDSFGDSVCGLTFEGAIYCWGKGMGYHGVVSALFTNFSTPTLVATAGQAFVRFSMANSTLCGITSAGAGWCWGTVKTMGSGNTNENVAAPRQIGAPR